MSPRFRALTATFVLFTYLTPSVAVAQAAAAAATAPPAASRSEAAERFDRALRLFEEGDNAAALAEFRRVQEIAPNPVVLYNIGLVSAAMGRSVEAVDALGAVLKDPATLGKERAARATHVLQEQSARIAEVDVIVNVPGARIEVDGVEVARAPLTAPIRVSSGSHVIGAVVEGYVPERREVLVAGRANAPFKFDLVEMQGRRLANLSLRTTTLGADVLVDGKVVARTPLAATLALAPGQHQIELRRAGYKPKAQTLELGDGATGELAWQLEVDPASLAMEGADVVLEVSEPNALVFVDGNSVGAYTGPLRLPKGPHKLRVERAGFFAWERNVEVAAQNEALSVVLEPTAQTRADLASNVRFHRTWGWLSLGGGALIAGAGVGFLVVNSGPKHDARRAIDVVRGQEAADDPPCDLSGSGLPEVPANTEEECQFAIDSAYSDYDKYKGRDVFGWIGVGVGAALVGTGIVLLATGDDPNKYAPKGRSTSESVSNVKLVPWIGLGTSGATLTGSF